jgi:serine protease Do
MGLAEVAERLRRVTVQVRAGPRGLGAGVVWLRHGLVVTNAHVAAVAPLEIVLPDGRSVPGRLVARDERRDLAAVGLPDSEPIAAQRVDARGLRPGEILVALGHPLGVANAVSLGIVHRVPNGAAGPAGWLQADIRLAPGNSGGPVADARGRVAGLNTMVLGGLGVAVPSHVVEEFVHEIAGRRGGARAA